MPDAGHFADRLDAAIACTGNAVVVGLDPRLDSVPASLLAACREQYGTTPQAAAAALWQFNRAIIEAVHDLVPAVKPQVACYARYGVEGMRVLARTIEH